MERQRSRGRSVVFACSMAWLGLLALLAWTYFHYRTHPHSRLYISTTVGTIPMPVLWFGALGGVLVSLSAVFRYAASEWELRWQQWHYARPFVGAAVAVVAVMIVMIGIVSIGSDPTPPNATGTAAAAGVKDLAYFLVAFLVGYREATFRALIKRLTDTLLAPGETTGTTVAPQPAPSPDPVTEIG
jgi:hypothetical protein